MQTPVPTRAPTRTRIRTIATLLIVLLLASTAGAAMAGKKQALLEKNKYAYSAAIRWGDFEGAWTMVAPKLRKDKPMSAAEFSRYEQIQISGYRDLASMPGEDGSEMREVQIDVINRNTMQQRRLRYTEVWRYDPEAKNWWIDSLPDFWQGQ
jgi:hypothetical protein